MRFRRASKLAVSFAVAALAVAAPLIAGQIKGEIKSIDQSKSLAVIYDEETKEEVTISLASLTSKSSRRGKNADLKDLKPGVKVIVNEAVVASGLEIYDSKPKVRGPLLQEFWHNFSHNLFKPLLLFFYLGFLVPILKVEFEFPYVIYQGLTIYLLLAIGWHGGEELAQIDPSTIKNVAGFILLGFVLNFFIGILAYVLLTAMTPMRRIDKATVAGYYGSDSAGTFATCVGVLGTVGMAFNAYMPVMLAVMEIPGCLVALYLVARLRHKGMDALGNMPDEPGYDPTARPLNGVPDGARAPRQDAAREGRRAGAGSLAGEAGASRAERPGEREEGADHHAETAARGVPQHRPVLALRRDHHRAGEPAAGREGHER